MDEQRETGGVAAHRRRWMGVGGLVGAGLVTGAILAGARVAGAATSSPSSNSSSRSATSAHVGGDPATMTHGPGETLVTGADLSTLTAEAKAAVPGATVMRVESDSNGGATYEAHMQRADGSFVTVQFDANLRVAGTVDGFGGGGPAPGSTA